jgi:hypothetical protein
VLLVEGVLSARRMKLIGDAIRFGISLLLGRIAGLRYVFGTLLTELGLSMNSVVALNDVGQLVDEQTITLSGSRVELASAEMDIPIVSEGLGPEVASGMLRLSTDVDSHLREICTDVGFQTLSLLCSQWCASALGNCRRAGDRRLRFALNPSAMQSEPSRVADV